MELWSAFLTGMDAVLIFPFRLPANPVAGFYLGNLVLVVWCLLVGEMTKNLVWLLNRSHYERQSEEMAHMHNLSVKAIAAKDKESYKACNKRANEYFGRAFFSQAALFSVSIWPLPFVLAWMHQRFAEVLVPLLPAGLYEVRYHAVFMILYIPARIAFSRVKKHLPVFSRLETLRRQSEERREKLVAWTDLGREAPP